MKKSEWYGIAVELQARWSNKSIPKESIEIWYTDLAHLPADQVTAAIRALYRDGREWVPNGGQILAKVAELSQEEGTADWAQAWEIVKKAMLKSDPMAFVQAQNPVAATVLGHFGGNQFSYMLDDEAIVRAQFRMAYENELDRQHKAQVYEGIPDAGLPGLQREPRKLGEAIERALPEPPEKEDADAQAD